MNHKVTKVHPGDNVLVALTNLEEGAVMNYDGEDYTVIAKKILRDIKI
jgi:hypothetical protein